MQSFERKTEVVKAVLWVGDEHQMFELTGEDEFRLPTRFTPARLYVAEKGRWLDVPRGFWVVRDGTGLFPCHPKRFALQYQELYGDCMVPLNM